MLFINDGKQVILIAWPIVKNTVLEAAQLFDTVQIMRERFVAMDLRLYMGLEKDRYYANSWVGSIFTIVGAADKTPITTGVSALWDGSSNATGVRRAAEITRLSAELDRLTRERKQKCNDTDMERIMKKTQKIQPVMDPSGIVYEDWNPILFLV